MPRDLRMTAQWSSPDPWACEVCPASGLGGKPAKDAHLLAHASAEPMAPLDREYGPIAPPELDTAQLRAWALTHGWPDLGKRGRIPQSAINDYVRFVIHRCQAYLSVHGGGR